MHVFGLFVGVCWFRFVFCFCSFAVRGQKPISCNFTVFFSLPKAPFFKCFFWLLLLLLLLFLPPLLLFSFLSIFHFLSSPSSFSCFPFFSQSFFLLCFVFSCFLLLNFILFKSLPQTSSFSISIVLLSFFFSFSCLRFLFLLLLKILFVQVRGCNKTCLNNPLFSKASKVSFFVVFPCVASFKCISLKTQSFQRT